jgi:hypothetical protein
MAVYRSRSEQHGTGNSLVTREVPVSTHGLVLNGVYHVDTLVRPGRQRVSHRMDPRLVTEMDGYNTKTVMGSTQLESLKLPGTETIQRAGWKSPEGEAEE